MDILLAIGIDQTVFVQLIIFLVTFFFLNFLVFKPYFNAHQERAQRTIGNTNLAAQVIEDVHGLECEYQEKAKKINHQHKTIFDESKTKAMEEYDSIISSARIRSKEILEKNKKMIQKEIKKSEDQLLSEVPVVSSAIASKILGKEIR